MTRWKLVVALSCALAIATLNTGVAVAEPLSKKEWRAEVKQICSDANDEVIQAVNAVVGDLKQGEEPTDDQFGQIADGVAPIIEGAIDDVNALDEPASLKKGVRRWLAAIGDVVDEIRDNPRILNESNAFKKPNKLAKKVGLRGCV